MPAWGGKPPPGTPTVLARGDDPRNVLVGQGPREES
jgi:hypothetical protein